MKKLLLLLSLALPLPAAAELYITIIQGLPGTDEYATRFNEQTGKLRQAAGVLAGAEHVKVLNGDQAGRQKILAHCQALQKSVTAADSVALFLIGHGSYDGHDYKFNVPGPDLTGADLKTIMNGWKTKRQLLVITSSASGAILKDLQQDGRIVITATRSGNERNAPQFGEYFVEALSNAAADTDKNDSISAAEAFAYAERQTKDYYQGEGRLATEHPQLQGEQAAQFQLARLTSVPTVAGSPELAALQKQRQQLDQAIEDLRARKDQYTDNNEYLNALQELILKLSAIDARIEALTRGHGDEGKTD